MDVYNRIRWDAQFDPARFFVGFETHDQGLKEVPFLSFVPGGEIPWHRVYYFRDETGVVWDRRTRVDRIFGSGEAAEAPEARFASSPGEPLAETGPVHTSALALLPPRECWGPIQAIRRAHDRHFDRWMPHVNLLYGFVPEARFPEAAERVARVAAGRTRFAVSLCELGTFDHRSSTTLWLRPDADPPGALTGLQAALQAAFPKCVEQSRAGGGFVPHLSLGQFASPQQALDAARTFAWRPLRFEAGEICLISRFGGEPFAVRHRIPLG